MMGFILPALLKDCWPPFHSFFPHTMLGVGICSGHDPQPALSVLPWVTAALGEMVVLYSIYQLILRPLGQVPDSFGVSRALDERHNARHQFSLLELC